MSDATTPPSRRTGTRTRVLTFATAALAALAVVILLRIPASEDAGLAPGSRAPELRAVTVVAGSEPRAIEDYRGHVVLLNVWATWCPPCLEEMPGIQALYEALADRGLRVVAVSIDDPGTEDQIRQFVREQGLTFEILHDPDAAIMSTWKVAGVPQTFLIDRAGRVRYTSFVADWRAPANRGRVEELIAEDS